MNQTDGVEIQLSGNVFDPGNSVHNLLIHVFERLRKEQKLSTTVALQYPDGHVMRLSVKLLKPRKVRLPT